MRTPLRLSVLYILLGIALLGFGCREEDSKVIDKLDPRLKLQVEEMESAMLPVILRAESALNDDQRRNLQTHGVVIQSETGNIVVCRIPLRAIMPVARETFVVRLEAPAEMRPQ